MAIFIVNTLYELFLLLILARIILSWIRVNPYHPLVQFIYNLTEPILAPIRNLMPRGLMIDFSPMVVLILASVLRQVLIMLLV